MRIQQTHFALLTALALLAGGTLAACGSRGATSSESSESSEPSEPAANDLVTVASDGTRFDPPVESSRVPAGAWMCDMGTVHYAALDQGDGKCPTCGMQLTQHTAKGGEAEHDHDHR